jgi:hypothetical protein
MDFKIILKIFQQKSNPVFLLSEKREEREKKDRWDIYLYA